MKLVSTGSSLQLKPLALNSNANVLYFSLEPLIVVILSLNIAALPLMYTITIVNPLVVCIILRCAKRSFETTARSRDPNTHNI